jgi:nitrite reductase/ring-hydroxylating ferredoxin subunit
MADSKDEIGLASRRVVLGGAGAAGLLGLTGALAACGSDDKNEAGTAPQSPAAAPSSHAAESSDSSDGGDNSLAKITDIPVGGGKIFGSDNVVVTQPSAGTFKAFSATCTHKGCEVKTVADGTINCPCHGAQFSITDGTVVTAARGMNKADMQGLPAKTVTVTGDNISVG